MYSCEPAEYHLSSKTRRFSEASQDSSQSSPRIRSPLFELHNAPGPLSSDHFSTPSDPTHMQSASITSSHCNDYTSASVRPRLTSTDSGLGIKTDENEFPSQFDAYSSEHSDPSYFEQEQEVRQTFPNKLASPFDEQFFTPAMRWGYQDEIAMLSNGAPTPYGTTPDHYFHPHASDYGPVQYMTPQASNNVTTSQSMSTPVSQFKRPMLRHNTTTSSIPQSTLSTAFNGTTSVEASPSQWTPQNENPIWYDTVSQMGDSSQIPLTMLDYVGYSTIDQNPQIVQSRQKGRPAMTYPQRRKPHLRPSFSESCVPRSLSPARLRALSIGHHLHPSPENHYMTNMPLQQLPLPPLPPSVLVKTPYPQAQTPLFPSMSTPLYRKQRSHSHTPQRWRRPSSPPPSDLNNANSSYPAPVRQDPTFPGDLYTPRYKRRTSTGRWEGWCGYCQPGRWLDLKNSRFWEDKLRNHGICAKTKMRFAEPEQIRWVAMDGKICNAIGLGLEVGDLGTDQKKREGLCGVCKTWVAMDGMRTKARDRAVGWWMHAYKCHDHDQTNEQHNLNE